MFYTVIALPPNFVTSTLAFATDLITDFGPYLQMILGVLMGVLVITILVGVFIKH